MLSRLPQRAALCLITTVAFVTAHELVHVGVGHWVGIGGHFTSLTSADADLARASADTAAAFALMAGAGPVFTSIVGVGALLAAPWARQRQLRNVATILGWLAVFGIPYIGIQLMTLGGPGGGVDTAAVLVGYFNISPILRACLAVFGVAFTIGAGYFVVGALGEPQSVSVLDTHSDVSAARRVVGISFLASSLCLIVGGAVLLIFVHRGNSMAAFLLANILWGVGMLIATPWRRPGPRVVRDFWLVPATAAMGVLTIVGVMFPSDYAAAGLFFLPQLATAAHAVRHGEFRESAYASNAQRAEIATSAV
jgi:hypothetical protein